MKDLQMVLVQSFICHYRRTGDRTGYVTHLVECGFDAEDITAAYHQFRDWLEKEEKVYVANGRTDV